MAGISAGAVRLIKQLQSLRCPAGNLCLGTGGDGFARSFQFSWDRLDSGSSPLLSAPISRLGRLAWCATRCRASGFPSDLFDHLGEGRRERVRDRAINVTKTGASVL